MWKEKKILSIVKYFFLLSKFLKPIYSEKFGTCKNIGFNNVQVYSKKNITTSLFVTERRENLYQFLVSGAL